MVTLTGVLILTTVEAGLIPIQGHGGAVTAGQVTTIMHRAGRMVMNTAAMYITALEQEGVQ